MKTFFSEWKFQIISRAQLRRSNEQPGGISRIFEVLDKRLNDQTLMPDEDALSHVNVTTLGRCETLIHTGRGTHFFITTPELLALILGMVRDVTPDILDVLAETRQSAFVIHPPGPSPAVICGIFTKNSSTYAFFSDGEILHALYGASFRKNERLTPTTYAERLVFGLALYMRFFPDAVREGLPETARHPAHYKGKPCKGIGMAEELVDRSGVKPHVRAAHFRFLTSERYTPEKRNTYVLVKESFVKGKCKIVVEAEELKNK